MAQYKKRWWLFGHADPLSGFRALMAPVLPRELKTEEEAKKFALDNLNMQVVFVGSFLLIKQPLNTYCNVILQMDEVLYNAQSGPMVTVTIPPLILGDSDDTV